MVWALAPPVLAQRTNTTVFPEGINVLIFPFQDASSRMFSEGVIRHMEWGALILKLMFMAFAVIVYQKTETKPSILPGATSVPTLAGLALITARINARVARSTPDTLLWDLPV